MLNDGTIPDGDEWSMAPATTLIQRTFIHNLLTEGVSVTLLQGCEFRNSKVCLLPSMNARICADILMDRS
jgi:hypothetical protein